MRKTVALLLLLVFFFQSCATYTISEARDKIVYPEKSEIVTRYNDIMEKELEREEEKKKEEESAKVNNYPLNLFTLSYPFYYNPVKNNTYTLSEEETVIATLFIPLGEERLSDEALNSIKEQLDKHRFSIIALSGAIDNQVRLATLIGKDAVTTKGGTIIFSDGVLSSMHDSYIELSLTENKKIALLSEDFHPIVPYVDTVDEALELVSKLEKAELEELINRISEPQEEIKILLLSSLSPSSLDWSAWTEYPYRRDYQFLFSDTLSNLNWFDAFNLSRFNEETESGITRRFGEYEERLDFVYFKGMIELSSYTFPIENLANTPIVATFLIP